MCERRLKQPCDYVTSQNIRRTSIRLSRRSANLKRICESQPSEPFRLSGAGSVPSWPRSVRKNVPLLPTCRLRFYMTESALIETVGDPLNGRFGVIQAWDVDPSDAWPEHRI